MLRFLFPLISLAIAGLSITVEVFQRPADSRVCLSGGCRFDQLIAGDATPETISALLNEDSADPGAWCSYGEFWSARGETAKAKAAFDRALVLGPGLSSVLMRVVNFDFTHDRKEEGLRLIPHILSQTDIFDGILFSYLGISGKPLSGLLGTAVPSTQRAAQSWLGWVRSQGADRDILDTWSWMRRNGFSDEKSAADTATTLWQHKSYRDSQELWAEWLGDRRGDYLNPQLLSNTRFQGAPSRTPFDWNLSSNASVEFIRRDGLDVHFLGKENLNAAGVEQFTAVKPGRYRFSAEVSGDNITTDEGPFFQITDAENSGRLSVETRPMTGNVPRYWINADFLVPAGTRAVQIHLARRPSLKFDDKIAGTLHIYQVSLLPSPRT